METVLQLINQAIHLLGDENEIIVFGSAAIVLYGVDLGRIPADLDLFASEAAFARLAKRFSVKRRDGKNGEDVFFIKIAKSIEVLKTFPSINFDEAATGARPMLVSGHLPVASLETLTCWKYAQGRDKDLEDIKRVEKFLLSSKDCIS